MPCKWLVTSPASLVRFCVLCACESFATFSNYCARKQKTPRRKQQCASGGAETQAQVRQAAAPHLSFRPCADGDEKLVETHAGVDGDFAAKASLDVHLLDRAGRLIGDQLHQAFNAHLLRWLLWVRGRGERREIEFSKNAHGKKGKRSIRRSLSAHEHLPNLILYFFPPHFPFLCMHATCSVRLSPYCPALTVCRGNGQRSHRG